MSPKRIGMDFRETGHRMVITRHPAISPLEATGFETGLAGSIELLSVVGEEKYRVR